MGGAEAGSPESDPSERAPAREGSSARVPTPLERLRIPDNLRDHPDTASLERALAFFEFGDYRKTRAELDPILASATAPAEILHAAQRMRSATGFEPGALGMLAACTVFFLIILWLVY